ncbi:MAG: hypothetical protein EZS28_035121 [Streblomastix strix]|uniref:Uncharacterized protein n=1 Tax=Streblomastix strix TaxID=222440 RepID=A0A5J4UGJ9_9EUKA|nr:MAG: hypothetical protein EZS28_035121 [Streblomastix strix]
MLIFPVAVRIVTAISFPDLRGFDQMRFFDGSSAYKQICDVSCPESPAKSARTAVIAFGGTSSIVAIY